MNRGKGRFLKLLAIGMALQMLPISMARADVLGCVTKVGRISVAPNGTVFLYLPGMGWPYMCNVNADTATSVGTISVEVCRAWVAKFTTAHVTNADVTFHFDYPTGTKPATCTDLANFSWQFPTVFPYFVMRGTP